MELSTAGREDVASRPSGEVALPETFIERDGEIVRAVRLRSGTTVETVSCGAPDETVDLHRAADLAALRREKFARTSDGGETVRIVDLFSGCGGLSLGAIDAATALGRPARLELAVDMDADPLTVLGKSLDAEDAVRQVDLSVQLDGHLGAGATTAEQAFLNGVPDRIDVLLAGPPCQGHSTLNNHTRHDDDRNDLYLRVARLIELRRPRFVLIENVTSVISDQRRSSERAGEFITGLGYQVSEGSIPLHTLGVPQRRRRHVLLASRSGEIKADIERLQRHFAVAAPAERTVGWALGDLLDLHPQRDFDRPSTPSEENRLRIRRLFEDDVFDLPNEYRPDCHRLLKVDEQGVEQPHKYKSMYGRLDWSKPAQTITSGYGSMGQGRYVHPRRRRTLTPHEAARLQMFPDFYAFDAVARRGSWARMIGNAAPMKLSYCFVLDVLR